MKPLLGGWMEPDLDGPDPHGCNAWCGDGLHCQVLFQPPTDVEVPFVVGEHVVLFGRPAVLVAVEDAHEAPDPGFEHGGKRLMTWRWL